MFVYRCLILVYFNFTLLWWIRSSKNCLCCYKEKKKKLWIIVITQAKKSEIWQLGFLSSNHKKWIYCTLDPQTLIYCNFRLKFLELLQSNPINQFNWLNINTLLIQKRRDHQSQHCYTIFPFAIHQIVSQLSCVIGFDCNSSHQTKVWGPNMQFIPRKIIICSIFLCCSWWLYWWWGTVSMARRSHRMLH